MKIVFDEESLRELIAAHVSRRFRIAVSVADVSLWGPGDHGEDLEIEVIVSDADDPTDAAR